MRSLTYTNPIGGSVQFSRTPFLIESLVGLDLPTIDIQEQKAPFQDGTTPLDQLFQPREVVLAGKILAPQNLSQIATYRRQILSALNPKAGPGSLLYQNDLRSYLLTAVLVDPSDPLFPNKDLTDPYQAFQITFYCHDPYLYDPAPTSVVFGSTASVINSGDVEASVTITIPGPCTNPTITNVTSGLAIAYVGSIASGASLVLCTKPGQIRCLLGGVNSMANIAATSTFWSLVLGTNTIEVTFGSGSPDITLAYSNKYLGA
jgi:phage-related protein